MHRAPFILMAALIVAALFCGNCLSCPQMWMAMAAHQPSHSCCHHRTARIDCHSGQFSHFIQARVANAAPTIAPVCVAPPAVVAVPAQRILEPRRPADASPPDLLSLHSLLRV